MKTRMICSVLFMLVVGVMTSAASADVYFWSQPAVGDWSDTSTWDAGSVPNQTNVDPHFALVANGTAVNVTSNQGAGRLSIGHSGTGEVNVAAGNDLHVNFELMFGQAGGDGVLNMSGTGYAEVLNMGMAAGSSGTINMFEGSTLTIGWWGTNVGMAGQADINLDGGQMIVYGTEATTIGNVPNFLMGAQGHVDIEAGILSVLGDRTALLQGYVNGGQITGYGGAGTVSVFYDAGTDFTQVTAIPEPATMVLLSLGGFLLRKRLA